MDINLIKLQEMVEDRGACSARVYDIAKSQTWLSDWTTREERKGKSMTTQKDQVTTSSPELQTPWFQELFSLPST